MSEWNYHEGDAGLDYVTYPEGEGADSLDAVGKILIRYYRLGVGTYVCELSAFLVLP